MKSDPFAPGDSPRHIKNKRREQEPDTDTRWLELIGLHATDHERAWMDEDPPGEMPTTEELERRQTLVDEFREQLATEGPDAELPTLEDITGELYQWHEGDRPEGGDGDPDGQPDGATSSGWQYIGEPKEDDQVVGLAVPPRNGPGSGTDRWREFASAATSTPPSEWLTMSREEIIAHLEQHKIVQDEK